MIIVKIILFPISLILTILYYVGMKLTELSGYIFGPVMVLAFIGGVSAFFFLNKITGMIFCGIGVMCFVIPCLIGFLLVGVDVPSGHIKAILY